MDKTKNTVVTEEKDDVIDLGEIFYLLWRHIAQIVLIAFAGAVVMWVISSKFIAPKYTATSRMYILSTNSSDNVDLSDVQISSQLKSDCQELLTSRTILEDVKKSLNLDMSVETMKDMITVTNPTDTRILDIAVTSKDPQESADISNAIAEKGKQYLPDVMKTQDISVFETAEVPTDKSSPNVGRNTLLGALIAALIYIAILIVKYISNDTLKTADDVAKYLGYQPLAVVPEHSVKKGKKKGGK